MQTIKKQWKDIRDTIKKINLELFNMLEPVIDDNDIFIESSYNYGEEILCNGRLCNMESETELKYSQIPLGITIDKNVEIFIKKNFGILPIDVYESGKLFGIYEFIDSVLGGGSSKSLWSMTAGSRSLISIQSIFAKNKLDKVAKNYGLSYDILPSDYDKCLDFFISLAKSEESKWACTIIFFPEKIINKVLKTKNYIEQINSNDTSNINYNFINMLYFNYWKSMNISKEIFSVNLEYSILSNKSKIIKKTSSIDDAIIKKLFMISKGKSSGFSVATEKDAPISFFQYVIKRIYKSPVADFLALSPMNTISHKPVLFSFLFPLDESLSNELLKGSNYIIYSSKIAEYIKSINDSYGFKVINTEFYSYKYDSQYAKGMLLDSLLIDKHFDISDYNLTRNKFFRAFCLVQNTELNYKNNII
ncbi:hypothetical protein [Cysteiniphilum marinum]|uniref:hypothetical protein n=1 Tax=Cysteiniphilum marinum TaxID=2774191 RepID=UPI00193C0101|nr:hypothetical protein [Cysteiniphilum marinum]